jgi:hypothetical protein
LSVVEERGKKKEDLLRQVLFLLASFFSSLSSTDNRQLTTDNSAYQFPTTGSGAFDTLAALATQPPATDNWQLFTDY